MDLRLTDYDLEITDGEIFFVTAQGAIAQHIAMRLRTWLGETVYDTGAGVPWLQVIFKGKNPNLDSINFILRQHVLDTPGVLGVELNVEIDTDTRVLSVTGTAQSVEGEIDFSEIIEANP